MFLLVLTRTIQSNERQHSSATCNTSSFNVVNISDIKFTRPLQVVFPEPNDRCNLLAYDNPYHSFAITPSCDVLSNETVLIREINKQRSNISLFETTKVIQEDYYIYAYNCTPSIQGPSSISLSWTKSDYFISFLVFHGIYVVFEVFIIVKLWCLIEDYEKLHNIIIASQLLGFVAEFILYFQEGFYFESIVNLQIAWLVIWTAINSLMVAYLLLFVLGFKTSFLKYETSHVVTIILTSIASFALNLFNTLIYFVVDRKVFCIITAITIPITVLVELTPFVVNWINLSRNLKEIYLEMNSEEYSSEDCKNIHAHNTLGLLMVLIQSITPMYIYFYDFSANTLIAAVFTHCITPTCFIYFMAKKVYSLKKECNDSHDNEAQPCEDVVQHSFSQDVEESPINTEIPEDTNYLTLQSLNPYEPRSCTVTTRIENDHSLSEKLIP